MYKLPLSLILSLLAVYVATATPLEIDTAKSSLSADCHATFHDFSTLLENFDCEIDVDPQTLAITAAHCTFRVDSLDSEEAKRDKKMKTWIDSESYPLAEFTLTGINAGEKPNEQIATGDFTLHGESHPIEVPFTVTRSGERIVIEGSSEFDYREWGLKKIRMFLLTVDPEVKPHFHLEGTLKKS
ncbi:YceI family protein [Puniceicoccus vermicola]|uniref:YceI family protein n=1 Tax=Puniceicoccus vermicola TaxID=388746 RepID=A0A7X1E6B8_9BACT|nr:YceI family protein [Puniceicoccus vermicola]MBC2603966.1 YceI family protein [Puniceicoccus vermicola]